MHARVTSVAGSPANIDAGTDSFRTNVVPFARDHGKGAILLIDRESVEGLAITLWEDEEAMRASEEQANELRAGAASDLGATDAPTVARYEVAVFEV